jgi:hypothetical protein
MRMNKVLALAGIAAALCLSAGLGQAQPSNNSSSSGGGGGRQGRPGRGNFDPAQFQQQMVERYKERLEITDDAEWKVIQPLIEKVLEARRSVEADRMRGFFDRGGGRPGGDNNQGGDQGGRRGFGGGILGQASPDAETLQKAIDAKASNSEMKAAVAKFVASRKAKQTELDQAQANLRKVLSVRQEAIATLRGLL